MSSFDNQSTILEAEVSFPLPPPPEVLASDNVDLSADIAMEVLPPPPPPPLSFDADMSPAFPLFDQDPIDSDKNSQSRSDASSDDEDTGLSRLHIQSLRLVFHNYSKPMSSPSVSSPPRPATASPFKHPGRSSPCISGSSNTNKQRMSGYHFLRLCRDSGLFSQGLSRSHCDIVFSRHKDARNTLTFSKFQQAVLHLAGPGRPSLKVIIDRFAALTEQHDQSSDQKLQQAQPQGAISDCQQEACDPKLAILKTSPSQDELPALFKRLTDPRHFTGTHRHRFDEHGFGKGLFGRDSIPKGRGIPASTTASFEHALRRSADVRGVPTAIIMTSE
eukprot:m.33845 g.33845  ORF g.33845 m.33845 type:complete len:332 (+) comp10938_c0_seq1:271-1266(+)